MQQRRAFSFSKVWEPIKSGDGSSFFYFPALPANPHAIVEKTLISFYMNNSFGYLHFHNKTYVA